jgi:hypothetical protein
MKRFSAWIYTIILLLNISCKCNSQIQKNTVESLEEFKCQDYFIISSKLEEEVKYKKILSAYLYNFLIGGVNCEILTDTNLQELYHRNSFKKAILLFYTDKSLEDLNIYEDQREWLDHYQELLYGVKDIKVLHDIANTLLLENKFEGVLALWEKADIKELGNINVFLRNVDKNNFYIHAEISAFYHVINEHYLSKIWLEKASKIKGFNNEYDSLYKLITTQEFFEYSILKENIYGTW